MGISKVEEGCDCPDCREVTDTYAYQDGLTENFLVRTRRIVLVGEINEISATHVCNQLQMFSLTKEPVYLYINSPGGSLGDGYSIIDQMMLSPCPVWTIIRGQSHSMAAIIAAFGEKGHRYAMLNSSIMLHSIIIQNPPNAHLEDHERMMCYTKKDWEKKVADLAKRLTITTKQLKELMNKTQWLSPGQAIKIGLIDGIYTSHIDKILNQGLMK